MKKKLMELLTDCGRCDKFDEVGGCSGCEYEYTDDGCEDHLTELMATDLLNARVVVLPVKPNDTVYTISRGKIKEWTVYYVGMNTRNQFAFNYHDKDFQNSRVAYGEDIGETVFLTEEDAINELKERKAKVMVKSEEELETLEDVQARDERIGL
jgi:hypothetical protein